jgi:hypothetical protein
MSTESTRVTEAFGYQNESDLYQVASFDEKNEAKNHANVQYVGTL